MPNDLQQQFDKLFPYLLGSVLLVIIVGGVVLLTPERSESQVEVVMSRVPVEISPVAAVINVNTATVEQLDMLSGIGPKLAEQIVALREQNLIHSVDDLLKVKGISEKLYSGIKDQLTWE